MAMNREQRRLLQRQGNELDESGQPIATRRAAPPASRPKERTKPLQFLREVRGELRKVAWPTKNEVINYSIIVLVALVVLTAFIAGLDWVLGETILRLYDAK